MAGFLWSAVSDDGKSVGCCEHIQEHKIFVVRDGWEAIEHTSKEKLC